MADQDHKCAHSLCECAARADSKYCSEYCEDADKSGIIELACGCKHAGCK
jgi:hypothetical protein